MLLLSRFAGASRELLEALVVNPYDVDSVAALMAALDMPPGQQRERMRAMPRQVTTRNLYRSAGRMLLDASGMRQEDRIRGKLRHVERGKRPYA